MAHSNYTSLTSLSFIRTDQGRTPGAVLIRAVPTRIQSALVAQSAVIYAKCLWLRTKQFGFDAAHIAILLEELFDNLMIVDTNNARFWRTLI